MKYEATKHNVDEALLEFLLDEFQPTIECVEAKGECDYRCHWADDACPCVKILDLKKKLEEAKPE
jgi:hypothetical protein